MIWLLRWMWLLCAVDEDGAGKEIGSIIDSGMDETAKEMDSEPEGDGPSPAAPAAPKPPPSSWTKEMHDYWPKLDPKVQEYWEARERQMGEGVEPLKAAAATAKRWQEVLAPHGEFIKSLGIDEHRAVDYLLNAHRTLVTGTPEARRTMFERLKQDYDIAEAADEPYTDPALKALSDEVAQLKSGISRSETAQRNAAMAKINQELEVFAKSHPLYNEVEEHIALLLQNPNLTLEQAYEQAVWANPTTRPKELARLEAEKAKAAKKHAQEAQRASGANVRGSEPRTQAQEQAPVGTKMEDTMREHLKTIKDRAAA